MVVSRVIFSNGFFPLSLTLLRGCHGHACVVQEPSLEARRLLCGAFPRQRVLERNPLIPKNAHLLIDSISVGEILLVNHSLSIVVGFLVGDFLTARSCSQQPELPSFAQWLLISTGTSPSPLPSLSQDPQTAADILVFPFGLCLFISHLH